MDEASASTGNGRASLTKEALADRTRFQFKKEKLDLSEWITGVVLELKTLSVKERDDLPELVDAEGNASVTIDKLAAVFAAVVDNAVVDGQPLGGLSKEEAQGFLGAWPADALDQVIQKFGELTGDREEQRKAASAFPGDK